ncbi:MAG: hypothetical protein SFX73_31360 [Kofleriaceae bacterium]|nr:hypothetical protein [Kofleriaceae bacterium]
MKAAVLALFAVGGLAVARTARVHARELAVESAQTRPFTPSPRAAPFASLGFRELAADLLFVRMAGYFGGSDNEAGAIGDLAEAITTLDPMFRRGYDFGAVAMTAARRGVDNSIILRSIALLERGAKEFPADWRFPKLAGQFYVVDLETDDPAQRRAWDERGTQLLEAASRKPGAPAEAGIVAVALQSKLGQTQAAIDSLEELLAVTDDLAARARIIEKLGELTKQNADEIAYELIKERSDFENTWKHLRPAIPVSMYVLVGGPIKAGFDLKDLSTGGRDLLSAQRPERLEPLTEPPTPSSP